MSIIAILLPVLMGIFFLAIFVGIIVSIVRSRRQMKQTQQMFDRVWNQHPSAGSVQSPFGDMMNNPFQTVNRVFESVAQQIEADDRAPQEQVMARVLSRRQAICGMHHASTSYYVTFELTNSDRMELHLPGHEYGLLMEGDEGCLTYQGSRFVHFERSR